MEHTKEYKTSKDYPDGQEAWVLAVVQCLLSDPVSKSYEYLTNINATHY